MSDSRKRLLKVKKKIDDKRPKFVQVESWRLDRIPPNWHRPRGLDDKVRRRIKGWPASPNVGYGSPKEVRNLHPSGMEQVFVYNVSDLVVIDPKAQVARIGGTVGRRKRTAIVDEALKRGIKILNMGKDRAIVELGEAEEAVEYKEEEVPLEESKEKAPAEELPPQEEAEEK